MAEPLDSFRLQAFAAVARERGFSRAARALGKTQSSVSQAVAQLESELGQRLFLREGRVTTLTEAGRLLLEHAERIFVEMAQARGRLEAAAELRGGELVIGTSDTLAYHVLPPVLQAFRKRYPGVELRLDNRPSPATAVAVAERRVHLGVVTLPLPDDLRVAGRPLAERVHSQALCPQDEVAIAPRGHPLAGRKRVGLAALLPYPLLLLDRSTGARAFLDAAFAALPGQPQVAMEMSSVEVLKRLVELGFGVAIVPALAVGREVKAGTLRALALTGLPGRRHVGLLTPAAAPLPRATAAFAELAAAVLRARRAPGQHATHD
jgi:DNA-binding transcriptional LysR family regulator